MDNSDNLFFNLTAKTNTWINYPSTDNHPETNLIHQRKFLLITKPRNTAIDQTAQFAAWKINSLQVETFIIFCYSAIHRNKNLQTEIRLTSSRPTFQRPLIENFFRLSLTATVRKVIIKPGEQPLGSFASIVRLWVRSFTMVALLARKWKVMCGLAWFRPKFMKLVTCLFFVVDCVKRCSVD